MNEAVERILREHREETLIAEMKCLREHLGSVAFLRKEIERLTVVLEQVTTRAEKADLERQAATDGPAYNRGRAEGRADVAVLLRHAVDPTDLNHFNLDGLLAAVKRLVDERDRLHSVIEGAQADLQSAEHEKAEKERDEARAEFHAINEHHCRHVAQLEERAEKVEAQLARLEASPQTADGVLAARLNQVERERDELRRELAAAGMYIKSLESLASDAGKDFLSREEVRRLLVRAVNRATLATATRKEIGPGAVMDDKHVGALVDAVLKECGRG